MHLASLFVAYGTLACFYASPEPYRGDRGWIVDAQAAAELVVDGASILDVRSDAAYRAEHVEGAVHTEWLDFSDLQPDAERGRLLADDARLEQSIRALGVDSNRPVVVVGDPASGWGEDGRILWMLRTLGHERAALVDGGHAALREYAPVTLETSSSAPGAFVVRRTNTWDIERDALKALVDAGADLGLVDTREPREFAGETPYGEERGGHLPGAVNVHYRALLNDAGFLRARDSILQTLEARGITADRTVVAYCTGGVRSAWFVAVLHDLGFQDVRNYAGSAWEWSASPEAEFPLGK